MSDINQAPDIVATYGKHGWILRRVLLTKESEPAWPATALTSLQNVVMERAAFDALWFARPSHGGREAWELRLIAETPYALFQAFESDETEELREDARREMEARMQEYVTK